MDCGAEAIVILGVQGIRTAITNAPKNTSAVRFLPPLESGTRDPSVPKKFKNGSTHPGCDYLAQAVQEATDSRSIIVGGARQPVAGRGMPMKESLIVLRVPSHDFISEAFLGVGGVFLFDCFESLTLH